MKEKKGMKNVQKHIKYFNNDAHDHNIFLEGKMEGVDHDDVQKIYLKHGYKLRVELLPHQHQLHRPYQGNAVQ